MLKDILSVSFDLYILNLWISHFLQLVCNYRIWNIEINEAALDLNAQGNNGI